MTTGSRRTMALVAVAAALIAAGCTSSSPAPGAGQEAKKGKADAGTFGDGTPAERNACRRSRWRAYEPDPVHKERDEIFALLAYALAFDDWQADEYHGRGRNIAAVIADRDGHPVCWGRNEIAAQDDATQHAELRALTSYLRAAPGTHARHVRLYATLEPCAMCAGAVLMTGVETVLYGRHAGSSGKAFERLAFDGHAHGGYCPYANGVTVHTAPTAFVARFDAVPPPDRREDKTARNEALRALHAEAARALDDYKARQPGNAAVLAEVQAWRRRIPRGSIATPYRVGCPSFEEREPGARP